MVARAADLYDKIYHWKDYEGEARRLRQLMKRHCPDATTVLDVGCGTAGLAASLINEYVYEGIDSDETMLERARQKYPQCTWHHGDMTSFELGRRYDVILCLFSAIGYVKTLEGLDRTADVFARHLERGGLILLEPWFQPNQFEDGRITVTSYQDEEVEICRMSHSHRNGRLSVIEFHYLVGHRGRGIEHLSEVHELAMFTVEEITAAFRRCRLQVSFDPGFTGRGLYICRS